MATEDLMSRYAVLQSSPSWGGVPPARRDELKAHVIAADDLADLTDSDRDLLRQGALEVSAGRGPAVGNVNEWGDWAAIDAAVESGDLDELDEALGTVGLTEAGGLRWDPTTRAANVATAADDDLDGLDGLGDVPATETKGADLGSDWVGL